mmetsp:Transcript_57591/g.159324  ORF Transcript_57591/g.159324 Transcript_57591/m.159324 type:complete len:1151 (+) Transcript_57591:120-3572(+)
MNATGAMSAPFTFPDSPFLNQVWAFIMATRAEIFLFCAAMAAYLLLFSNQAPRAARPRTAKAKRMKDEGWDWEEETCQVGHEETQRASSRAERGFQAAFEAGDFREVLRCWTALRRAETVPSVSLAQVVEAMQRLKRDTPSILREVKAFFKRYPSECNVSIANGLLESLGRRLDSELAERVAELLPSVGVVPDARTYEILLQVRFTTRDFSDVQRLIAEMEACQVPLSPRAAVLAVRTALKTGRLDEAVRHFGSLRALWTVDKKLGEGPTSPSTAPRHIASQIVELACKEHQLAAALPLLDGMPLCDEAVLSMLNECSRKRDVGLARQVERLARARGAPLSDPMYTQLVKAFAGEARLVQELFDEVAAQGRAPSADFAQALLHFCSQTGDLRLADRLFELTLPKQNAVLTAFLRFYADGGHHERACEVYEQHFRSLRAPTGVSGVEAGLLDTRLERSLMNAALRCGRQDLAKDILDSSPSDMVKHFLLIRNFAAANDLEGAKGVFQSLVDSGAELNSVVYNTVLEACVECRDLAAAEAWMGRMKEAGFTDIVSYNTLIKAYLHAGNFQKARALISKMQEGGLQPNHVTFNELVNGLISKGTEAQRREVWEVVREMKASGVRPNQVTCSILLKNLNSRSREEDIVETMELINSMEAPMDEVLLSSVVEACVRIGKPDLLASKLQQFQGSDAMVVNGSHTFGSLIKAYGYAKDINAVWRCWRAMRSRHIRPTSITLGCMVEAVVSNGDTEGAYELIHEMLADERCKETLNSVIYCSVLKGFTREKKLNRVWAVYQEMLQQEIDLSIVTYNTVIDACARCGRMDRLPELLADMKKHNIERNLITYSTMLKGYCQMGDIQKGFAMFEQMKQDINQKPDEIMYNSLLDGCAQINLVEEGLGLLRQMELEGVKPSNFTLSLVVKLMSRARKLDRAFALVQDISKRHTIRLNVHVYTNLMQACVSNRQSGRAMSTFEDMIRDGVRPENRTYAVLVRASLGGAHYGQAAGLLRAALGLRGALPLPSQAIAACHSFDSALLGEALQTLADKGQAQELAVPLISDIRRFVPHVKLDATLQRRVMAAGVAQETGHQLTITYEPREQQQGTSGRVSGGRAGRAGSRRRHGGPEAAAGCATAAAPAGHRRNGRAAVPATAAAH